MRVSRILFWGLAASLSLSVLVMLFFGLIGWTRATETLVAVMWTFNGHFAAAAIARSAYERRRARPLAVIGIAAGAIGWLLWTWFLVQSGEIAALRKWGPALATPFTALAAYAAFTGAMLHLPYAGAAVLWLRRLVLAIAALAAIHIAVAVAVYPMRTMHPIVAAAYIDAHWRWAGIYLVLIAYVTMLAAAALGLRRLRLGGRSLAQPMPVRITCPRCERSQELMTEGDSCRGCGLRIKVALL